MIKSLNLVHLFKISTTDEVSALVTICNVIRDLLSTPNLFRLIWILFLISNIKVLAAQKD